MWLHNIFYYVSTPDVLEMSSDDEMIGKKFGSGKRNDTQPANSDEAESEASDKEKSSG